MAAWRRDYTPGPLTSEELEQFWTAGYVIKRGLLKREELQPAREAVARMVDQVRKAAPRATSSSFEEAPLSAAPSATCHRALQ